MNTQSLSADSGIAPVIQVGRQSALHPTQARRSCLTKKGLACAAPAPSPPTAVPHSNSQIPAVRLHMTPTPLPHPIPPPLPLHPVRRVPLHWLLPLPRKQHFRRPPGMPTPQEKASCALFGCNTCQSKLIGLQLRQEVEGGSAIRQEGFWGRAKRRIGLQYV